MRVDATLDGNSRQEIAFTTIMAEGGAVGFYNNEVTWSIGRCAVSVSGNNQNVRDNNIDHMGNPGCRCFPETTVMIEGNAGDRFHLKLYF